MSITTSQIAPSIVSVALVVCLCAAVVGVAVPGLFPLTVVALGGLLVAGASAVSLQSPAAKEIESADATRTGRRRMRR